MFTLHALFLGKIIMRGQLLLLAHSTHRWPASETVGFIVAGQSYVRPNHRRNIEMDNTRYVLQLIMSTGWTLHHNGITIISRDFCFWRWRLMAGRFGDEHSEFRAKFWRENILKKFDIFGGGSVSSPPHYFGIEKTGDTRDAWIFEMVMRIVC